MSAPPAHDHQAGLKIVGETLPHERNRVTLADERDQYGLPVARVTWSYCDNDRRLISHALGFMAQALEAAGARRCVIDSRRFRMTDRAAERVR